MEKTVRFTLERETKGAIRYQEVTEAGDVATVDQQLIGTLYLRKSGVGREVPASVEVTVRTA